MAQKYATLTRSQKEAITQCVSANGPRMWKSAVRMIWERGKGRDRIETILYGLRNSHGPSWLKNYRFDLDL
jgi:hypothetical protein